MIVPKLRFSEFKDEWIESKIGENFNVTSGTTPLRSEQSYFANPSIYWVKTTDLNNGIIKSTEEKISKIALAKTSLKILPKNTVFVAMYGGFNQIGRTGILSVEATCNQALSAIYPNENFNPYFVLTYLNHKVDDWKNFAASSRKDPNITKNDVLSFPIIYPTLTEQTKIAEFLSAVDDKISQLSRQLELLKQYKKGVMQKIFSQEIRFKNENGEDFGEWEKHSLKVLLNKIVDNRGKTPETSLDEKIPLIEVNAIGNKSINYSKILKHVSNETYKTWFRSHIEENDVLFSTVGNTAMCSIFYGEKLACIAQNIVGLRANHQFITGDFLYYLLTEEKNNRLFKSIEMQAVQPSIKVSQMIDLVFNVPTIQEQAKIAEFLTAIDKRIDHTTAQLTHTKQWKKGLLQQMFV